MKKKKGYAWWIELKCKELEWMNELLLFNWEELKKKKNSFPENRVKKKKNEWSTATFLFLQVL